jgi:hypothetical protein
MSIAIRHQTGNAKGLGDFGTLFARLAQWKSTSFTRKGSQVQALQRAPFKVYWNN